MRKTYKQLYKELQQRHKVAILALETIKDSVIANQDFSKREAIQALKEIKQQHNENR